MSETHLFFNTAIGVKKPGTIRNKEQSCPFCAREELTDIIDVQDPIILLKNKYPVLENAFQTVIIETDDCLSELSLYTKEHLEKLLSFGIKHWNAMEASGKFKSVIFFKNHGPLSGGTIAHPHMQIIGLNNIDYQEGISKAHFDGLKIQEKDSVLFTLSTKPKVGFYEFNVKMAHLNEIGVFASYVQIAVHYILNHFPFQCNSYNLFFYKLEGEIYVKVMPRFITTPLYMGYSIPQVPNNLNWMQRDIIEKYFCK
jgi:ATP adenylyltransferase/5',5'''-P-1,P-4-tetraphosphate phosphorylase II